MEIFCDHYGLAIIDADPFVRVLINESRMVRRKYPRRYCELREVMANCIGATAEKREHIFA